MLLAVSCDSSVVYSDDMRVDEQGWNAADALVFNMTADDTVNTFLCCLDIRNTFDYPFSNIYFNIKTIYPDGALAVDTNIQFVLADPDGRWRGKQSGKYIDGRYPFCYIHFPQKGNYRFEVSHAMRDTVLTGIKSVGMAVVSK